ncbi:MAG: hypothetical protein V7K14_16360 [Nostoc sp.]|uniref:hypothetical protein n=1 Tax=Nostoc sp. TaxID=1180 RepID=UPI002FF4BD71
MDIPEKFKRVVEQLNEEELSTLLDFAIFLQSKGKSAATMVESHAYTDWLSAENDIYDELFTDQLSTR